MSVGWLEILERAQSKRSTNNALLSTDEHLENAGGDGVDKRVKRGDDDTPVASVAEVFELAREYFPERDGLSLLPPVGGGTRWCTAGQTRSASFEATGVLPGRRGENPVLCYVSSTSPLL